MQKKIPYEWEGLILGGSNLKSSSSVITKKILVDKIDLTQWTVPNIDSCVANIRHTLAHRLKYSIKRNP